MIEPLSFLWGTNDRHDDVQSLIVKINEIITQVNRVSEDSRIVATMGAAAQLLNFISEERKPEASIIAGGPVAKH